MDRLPSELERHDDRDRPRRRLDQLLALARAAFAADPQAAHRDAEAAASLASDLGERRARAEALRLVGRTAALAGQHEAAVTDLHRALAEYEAIGEHAGAAKSLVALGNVYESLDDGSTALQHYHQAAALEEESADHRGLARTLCRISGLLLDAGDHRRALDTARKALAACGGAGRARDQALALIAVGEALRAAQHLGESVAALAEAASLLSDPAQEADTLLAKALCALAESLGEHGEGGKSEATWTHARDRAARAGDAALQCRAWLGLGRAAMLNGHHSQARRAVGEALAQALLAEDLDLRAECHAANAELYRIAGESEAALVELEAARLAEQSARRDQARNRMKAAEIRQRAGAGTVDHGSMRALALAKAYAELETLNASLRAADRAKTDLLAQLERKTFEDALTGLHNRRYAELRLAEEFQRAVRHARALSVAVVDIDGFRRINDEVSHAVGDRVLKAMAEVVSRSVRVTDIVSRYGSDQFAVILPETDATGAALAAQKIREGCAAFAWSEMHPTLAVTVSIGVASSSGMPDHEKMLSRAERSLRLAKAKGGNRVGDGGTQ